MIYKVIEKSRYHPTLLFLLIDVSIVNELQARKWFVKKCIRLFYFSSVSFPSINCNLAIPYFPSSMIMFVLSCNFFRLLTNTRIHQTWWLLLFHSIIIFFLIIYSNAMLILWTVVQLVLVCFLYDVCIYFNYSSCIRQGQFQFKRMLKIVTLGKGSECERCELFWVTSFPGVSLRDRNAIFCWRIEFIYFFKILYLD